MIRYRDYNCYYLGLNCWNITSADGRSWTHYRGSFESVRGFIDKVLRR